MGKQWKQCQTLFWGGSKITADGDCSHETERRLLLGKKVMTNLHNILKSRDITLPTITLSSQGYGFSSSPVWMWELDYKESWARTNWCFWTVVLEKTLESPLDSKEIQPVHPERNQSWIFIGRTDAEAETPILWPPNVKNWLIWKDPDAGKDWRQEEKGTHDRGWDGWMASPTQRTWVWVNSGSWWWIRRPGVLQSMGLQRVGHDWSDSAAAAACSLSWWCHSTISSSVVPFSSHLQSFPASRSFQMSQFFTLGGQSTGASASASVLQMNLQDWFPGWISLQSKGLSRVFSNTTVQKHPFFGSQLSL